MAKQRVDGFTEFEESYADYEVYDLRGEKIGKVDDLFVDEDDNPEYVGVKMGFLGLRSTLIPMEAVRVDESRRVLAVSQPKDEVKEGPAFDDDEEITPEYEERVRGHYGLEGSRSEVSGDRGTYGAYGPRGGRAGERHPGTTMGDTDRERGEFREHPPSPGYEGVPERGDDLRDENELTVQRTEEELRAGTREREVGGVNVRKRVRTDRERLTVPKRREEVHVERVPVEGREATEAAFGDDEVFMPVTEEEVVVEKRPMVKEEVRLRKTPVEEEEIVEEDVRKEEIDIDDQTTRRRGL